MSSSVDDFKHGVLDGLKLNLGCGPVQPEGWVNIDGSNRAFLKTRLAWIDNILVKAGLIPETEFGKSTKYANLLKGLPYPNDSVAYIYAGELWEHFEFQDAIKLTRECYRVLMPGGVLRVCVPDGARYWGEYLRLYQEQLAKSDVDRNPKILSDYVDLFFKDICTRRVYLGSMGHTHKWSYDEVQLVSMFANSGFLQVHRAEYHQSRIPEVEKVERSDFLIVEGIK